MPPALSLLLDALRFLAAVVVLLSHLRGPPFVTGIHWRFGPWGDTAVMVFFVLSGYVIAHVMATRETDLRSYAAARIARLHSVLVLALPVTAMCDAIGMQLAPLFYQHPKLSFAHFDPWHYLASWLLVHEFHPLGLGAMEPGTNRPFWSLSFEATYYAVAGLMVFVRAPWGLVGSLLLLLAAGSTIMALLPVWTAGLLVYHARALTLPRALLHAIWLAGLAVLLALPNLGADIPTRTLMLRMPWGVGAAERRLALDLIGGLAFALALWAVRDLLATRPPALPGPRMQAWIRYAGRTTFPLYCVHYPVIALVAALLPGPTDSLPRALAILLAVAMVTWLVTGLSEPIRLALRRGVLRLWPERAG